MTKKYLVKPTPIVNEKGYKLTIDDCIEYTSTDSDDRWEEHLRTDRGHFDPVHLTDPIGIYHYKHCTDTTIEKGGFNRNNYKWHNNGFDQISNAISFGTASYYDLQYDYVPRIETLESHIEATTDRDNPKHLSDIYRLFHFKHASDEVKEAAGKDETWFYKYNSAIEGISDACCYGLAGFNEIKYIIKPKLTTLETAKTDHENRISTLEINSEAVQDISYKKVTFTESSLDPATNLIITMTRNDEIRDIMNDVTADIAKLQQSVSPMSTLNNRVTLIENNTTNNTTKIGVNTTDIVALQNRMTDNETLATSNKNRISELESNQSSSSGTTTIGYSFDGVGIKDGLPTIKSYSYNTSHASVSLEDTLLQFMNDTLASLKNMQDIINNLHSLTGDFCIYSCSKA